jgi:hypothetical protein
MGEQDTSTIQQMTNILSKLLESDDLDQVFRPHSDEEFARRILNGVGDWLQSSYDTYKRKAPEKYARGSIFNYAVLNDLPLTDEIENQVLVGLRKMGLVE